MLNPPREQAAAVIFFITSRSKQEANRMCGTWHVTLNKSAQTMTKQTVWCRRKSFRLKRRVSTSLRTNAHRVVPSYGREVCPSMFVTLARVRATRPYSRCGNGRSVRRFVWCVGVGSSWACETTQWRQNVTILCSVEGPDCSVYS